VQCIYVYMTSLIKVVLAVSEGGSFRAKELLLHYLLVCCWDCINGLMCNIHKHLCACLITEHANMQMARSLQIWLRLMV